MSALTSFNSFPEAARTLAFVGGGQMATALIGGLIRAGWLSQKLQVLEPDEAQRYRLQNALGVAVFATGLEALSGADAVVWAVKPQVMAQAIEQNQSHLGQALHISIAAGLRTTDLAQWMGTDRLVRAMPNTPALVGSGVTGLVAAAGVSRADRELTEKVFSTTGHCLWVESDERIDAITAISGSGPAYVFQFLESFQAAATALGFSEVDARTLVLKTAEGAIRQAAMGDAFSVLRERVTSRRGTTEAALAVFSAGDGAGTFKRATEAAYLRAQMLSYELAAS